MLYAKVLYFSKEMKGIKNEEIKGSRNRQEGSQLLKKARSSPKGWVLQVPSPQTANVTRKSVIFQ